MASENESDCQTHWQLTDCGCSCSDCGCMEFGYDCGFCYQSVSDIFRVNVNEIYNS